MYKFKYREREHAKELLKSGFTSNSRSSELKILAKHYKESGKSEDEIKDLLCKFCEDNLAGYNFAIHYKMINSAINSIKGDKGAIIQIDNIGVTKSELEYIDNLDIEHDLKKVVFSLLVITKLNRELIIIKNGELKSEDYFFGDSAKYRTLSKVSMVTFNKSKKSTVKNIHDAIRILDEKGIVEIVGNSYIKLNFMYGIEQDGEIGIRVEDYHSIGLYYDVHCGVKGVKKCDLDGCRTLIKQRNNKHKYCKSCAVKTNIQKTIENREK